MTSLQDLDSRVLNILTSYLNYKDISNLYQCYNKILCANIKSSITHLNVTTKKKVVIPAIVRGLKLKSLTINRSATAMINNNQMSMLPLHLETLICNFNASVRSFKKLPPNITHLHLRCNTIKIDLSNLSKITKLELPYLSKFNEDINLSLPPNLTSLDVSKLLLNNEQIMKLPTTLRELSTSLLNDTLVAQTTANLPRNLSTLTITNCCRIKEGSSKELPRNLTRLNLHLCRIIDNGELAHFPRDLTHLNLEACHTIKNNKLADLPRKLKWLDIRRIDTEHLVDDNIEDLPVNLEYLDVSYSYCRGKNITKHDLKKFPTTLTELRTPHWSILEDDVMGDLPRHLKKLDCIDESITDMSAPNLPRGLTYLSLCLAREVSSASFIHLPRTITYLDLRSSTNINDDHIQYLPRGLTYLDFKMNKTITDSSIGHLPRNITHLNLKNNPNLTDECIEYLPRGLTYLDLGKVENISDVSIPKLPTGIKYLDMKRAKYITIDMVPQFPRSLTYLKTNVNGMHLSITKEYN